MRDLSVKIVEELLATGIEYAENPVAFIENTVVLAAKEWLTERKTVVCVERTIRYTGNLYRMEKQLEGSIARDNPKEFDGMRIEEISRVVVE